jgi:hypothetical protein
VNILAVSRLLWVCCPIVENTTLRKIIATFKNSLKTSI